MLESIRLILTLKCEQSTRLVSESRDRDLPFSERWAVRLHAVGCRSCRRYAKQLQLMSAALGRYAREAEPVTQADAALSEDARNRIHRAIVSADHQNS